MRVSVRTLTNKTIEITTSLSDTVGNLLQCASDTELCSWRPGESHKDVVLVHRRTFKRFCDVEQSLDKCGIVDGDALELTIRFAAQPVVSKLCEPIGFYEVSPRPASAGVSLHSDIVIHLVNVVVEGRPCLVLSIDDQPQPAVQLWQAPNILKLVPSAPLRAATLYTVTLDLNLDSAGIRVLDHDGYDLSCIADGVDIVRPYVFVWHFQTGASKLHGPVGSALAAGTRSVDAPGEAPVHEVVRGLASRSLDGCSKKQLLALQGDLGGMLNRVGVAITHIDEKIDAINRRLQEKSRGLSPGLSGGDGPSPDAQDGESAVAKRPRP